MRLFSIFSLVCFTSLPLTPAMADYATQVQVFFDAGSGQTARHLVRVIDPEPELGLAFRWHPVADNLTPLDAEGRAQGQGRVVWRLAGLSEHDPRAWHHSYEGALQAGRFHGDGRLRWRDGREMRGAFAGGRLHGPGLMRDAGGNIIEAAFVDGLAQGAGIYRARAGWVWRGGFVDGVMQGAGEMTEAGGRRYSMVMQAGQPESALPSGLAAHPLVAGLRPAQGGASMADRAEMSIAVDERLAAQQWGPYISRPDGERVFIHPASDAMVEIWQGNYTTNARMALAESLPDDWADNRALALVDLEIVQGSRATLESLSLRVEASAPHLQPVLAAKSHIGCVPFRPSFEFLNHGWGMVENPRLRVRFANPDTVNYMEPSQTEVSTDWVDVALDGFDAATDVDLRGALSDLGADVTGLATARFPCPETRQWDQCFADAMGTGLFGEFGPHIQQTFYGKLMTTTALAELSFDWTDFAGDVTTDTRHFDIPVSLGMLEIQTSMAECGAGGAWPTEAPQFHDVELAVDGVDYAIDLPLRGNPNIEYLEYGLKLYAERSSMHLFQVAAQFADGSVRLTPTTLFYFLNPRYPEFTSRLKPAQCNLGMDDTGMC